MLIKILTRSRVETTVHYTLTFSYLDHPRGQTVCAGFDCDAEGRVDVHSLNPVARANYEEHMRGEVQCLVEAQYDSNWERIPGTGRKVTVRVTSQVERVEHRYRIPAVGRCYCGKRVTLGGFTNTCRSCGREYNSAGQELAPREQWGEETGEHPADLARI